MTAGGFERVLRLTPVDEETTPGAVRATLHWLGYAAARGGAVCVPVPAADGALLHELADDGERYLAVAYERAPGRRAEEVPVGDWSDGALRALGAAVGRLHAISAAYMPADPRLLRPEWRAVGNCFRPDPLPASEGAVAAEAERRLAAVEALPRERADYGLIHTDLHLGNVCLDEAVERVTILDWDDCSYGWYAMDLALLLLDALVLCPPEGRPASGGRFLRHLLAGYRSERALAPRVVLALPRFLALLQAALYTQVWAHREGGDPWIDAFPTGRRERILAQAPYVDLGWETLAGAT